jgi:hypothetical protein
MTEPKNESTTDEAKVGAVEGYEAPTPGGWDDYPLDELAIRDERRTAEDVVRRIEKGRFVRTSRRPEVSRHRSPRPCRTIPRPEPFSSRAKKGDHQVSGTPSGESFSAGMRASPW